MTKADEVAVLQSFVRKLGDDSYTGPWLKGYLPAILGAIVNDVTPDVPLPWEARREAEEILSAAKRRAEALIEAAEAKARSLEAVAAVNVQRYRDDVARQLRRCLSELER
jgi:hypothetical protein